ncbi:hypothetical protein ACFLU9_03035 [Chloroflexota bacterium]
METKVTHMFTGSDGESHFKDIMIPFENSIVDIGQSSEIMKASGLIFGELESNYEQSWHNAPRRQFIITLEGEGEYEIGDGTKRRFGPGDILLAEDTTGRGHKSRDVNSQPRKIIVVTLD